MKKSILILLESLFVLVIFYACTANSKNDDNKKSIEKCRVLLKQAENAPVLELSLPLGLKFGLAEKEVYKIMDELVAKGSLKKIKDFYYTDFVASNQKFNSMLMFEFSTDSLSSLNFILGNSMLNFDPENKKFIVEELNKKNSLGYTYTSVKVGDVEKDNPEKLTEYNYWIKNNLVVEFQAEYGFLYCVRYLNAPVDRPIIGLDLTLGINSEVQKETKETKSLSRNTNNKAALDEIKKEPKIFEAFLTDANVLYVSVADDGTRRDGYAEYLCQIIKEHNATIEYVKVVKAGSTKDPNRDNAYGVLLGECFCK